jgi:hypothetical protein
MVSLDAAAALALALPEASEQPYHGIPSFRVAGKIFANLPDEDHMHIMLGEDEIQEAVNAFPNACEEKLWGKKTGALRVTLSRIKDGDLKLLLQDAWRRRAPKRLGD